MKFFDVVCTPREMLHRSLTPRIRSVETRKRAQQRGGNGNNLPAVGDMDSGLFEDEEGSFGVDPAPTNLLSLRHNHFVMNIVGAYANIESYSSSLISAIGFLSTFPMVFTTMSTLPKSRSTSWKSFVTAVAVVRSPW